MMSPYQAVILAAGRGSRLCDQTEDCPKALLPLGPRSLQQPLEETSFLRRQIDLLQQQGVTQIVVVMGYQREKMARELQRWAPGVKLVVNPAPNISDSGSLDSFCWAMRSPYGVLKGQMQTLLMDADIVYHREVLRLLLQAPEETSLLVCSKNRCDNEEVLVYGTAEAPRFMGKGLTSRLVAGAPCIGEATGIVKFAPADHQLVRETILWMVGDPDAPLEDPRRRGFAPAKGATEHEELSQRFMYYGRMRCLVFGAEWPFIEVDTPEEYRELRETFYPQLLRMEAEQQKWQ
jgi:choline kinase